METISNLVMGVFGVEKITWVIVAAVLPFIGQILQRSRLKKSPAFPYILSFLAVMIWGLVEQIVPEGATFVSTVVPAISAAVFGSGLHGYLKSFPKFGKIYKALGKEK